jgi:hypothetical protein
MKHALLRTSTGFLFVLAFAFPALGQKPQDVIEHSNGFPSGAHFKLNLHGKKELFTCDADMTTGGSVFVSEYGTSTLEYMSNRKSQVTELMVLDACSEALDGDPARVQLPSEAEGYYVFGRILGKPNNGANGGPSKILLTPNPVLEICNDDPLNPDPTFPDATDCDSTMWSLGLVTTNGVYETTEAGFERFDSTSTGGKGKSMAKDITGLFLWTGFACLGALDLNGDGVLDAADVPMSYDLNMNGMIDPDEFQNFLADQVTAGTCVFFENEWVFNIADLVVQSQTIENDGTKLLQIRFYPVATTSFVR